MGKGTNRQKPNGAGFTKKEETRRPSVSRRSMLEERTLTPEERALCDGVASILMDRHRERKRASVQTPRASIRRDANLSIGKAKR